MLQMVHIRHSNPQKKDPQRIKKADKHYIEKLDYSNIEFPVSQKHYNKIEKQNNININVFGYEEKQPFPIYVSKEKFDDHMNLLLITEGENKHCILIKDFNKFMYNQTEHKERKHFCMYCLQCFSSEKGFAWWYIIIYIANRYGKANNKYMKSYDEKAPSKYIVYLDANNLYGSSLSQYLPTGGFRWLTENEINKINLQKYKKNSKKGLILEADLEYPKELHDLHNDYPLGPEKVKVTENMLSDYCKKIQKKYKISIGQVHKLIPTLNNKEKYVLHYRNLQLYLNLGLKITKIHRVLGFNQSPWLKQYIHFNTEKRKNTTNSFEKDFFKLMNNSVFGKTMENLRKRVNVKLVTDEKKLLQIAARPTFINSKIINENLVAVHKIKETLTLDRPAYVGMCVLDLSKTLMYDCHYNYIKNKHGNKAKLLFTDTDSLTYEIEAEDVYRDFWKDKDQFDYSDYPEDSPYFDKTNKKVIGKFKDEAAGMAITEFIGLRSKMYSYIKDNNEGGKAAKGIKKNIIKNNLTHENYKSILLEHKCIIQ